MGSLVAEGGVRVGGAWWGGEGGGVGRGVPVRAEASPLGSKVSSSTATPDVSSSVSFRNALE